MTATTPAPAGAAGTVIVGAGQAGAELAANLRRLGDTAPITLVGEEPIFPYRRPPLSKAVLAGEVEPASLAVRPEAFYLQQRIALRLGVRATAIERGQRVLRLSDGSTLAYDRLVLALGGRAQRPPVPGIDAPGVHVVRTFEDARGFRAALAPGSRLVVVGGGYLGLEAASVAVKREVTVTVLEAQERLLARVASAPVSAFVERMHREAGVALRPGAALAALEAGAAGLLVRLSSGEVLAADAVLLAVGLRPETGLAEQAGLDVSNGIVVDARMRTSDPSILAIGDCAALRLSPDAVPQRVESVANAIDQARIAAATLCDQPAPAPAVPAFWSEQYGLRLQSLGIARGDESLVLRGDPADGRFTVLHLRDGRMTAAEFVGRPEDVAVARALIASGAPIDPLSVADPGRPLGAAAAEPALAPG